MSAPSRREPNERSRPRTRRAARTTLTPKQQVLKRYPRAEVMLTAMWGYRIFDYEGDVPGFHYLSGLRATNKTEAQAWADAARKLTNRTRRP